MKTTIVVYLFSSGLGYSFSRDTLRFESNQTKGVLVLEPIYKLTQLNNQSASIIGLKLDWILFNKYEIGAKINYLNNIITPAAYRFYPNSPELELIYGGIEPGFKFPLSEKAFFYFSFFIGYEYASYNDISEAFDGKYFWIIESGTSFAYNIIDLIELKLGVNYRNAFNVNKVRPQLRVENLVPHPVLRDGNEIFTNPPVGEILLDKIRYYTCTTHFSPGQYDMPIERNHFNFEVGFRFHLLRL